LQCSSDATLSGPDSEYLPSHATGMAYLSPLCAELRVNRGRQDGHRTRTPKGGCPAPTLRIRRSIWRFSMFWPSYHLCLVKTSLDVDETLSNAAQFLHTLGDASSLPHRAAADDERAETEEWALSATTRAQPDSRWYRCSQSPTKTPQHGARRINA